MSKQSNANLNIDTARAWLSRVRVRAAIFTLVIAGAAWAVVAFSALAWLPVVGVAVAAVVVSVNKVADRLTRPMCLSCGQDLTGQTLGPHGCVCPTCGALHMPRPEDVRDDRLAGMLASPDQRDEHEA
ncbi:MAG: hypothetical protein ACK5WB_09855 [Phycisphaerales bacterium]|jgi:hypothetical protein|nr:hypothetical protein [Phycisphaeraceae bacterium]